MKGPARYHFMRVLGYGASGAVYEVMLLDEKKRAAVKCIELHNDARIRKAAQQEAELQSTLQHESIVTFLSAEETVTDFYLALELCTQGSLHSLLFSSSQLLKNYSKDSICAQLCAAVHYLHEGAFDTMAVIHRDIKVENILLADNMRIKLADFGAALVKPKGTSARWGIAGTPGYMSPEMLAGKPYGTSTDAWSLGLVLFEVWSGSLWTFGSSDMSFITSEVRRKIERLPEAEKKIVSRFVCPKPGEREKVGWALSMPKMMSALMGSTTIEDADDRTIAKQPRNSILGIKTQYNTAQNSRPIRGGEFAKNMPPFRFL